MVCVLLEYIKYGECFIRVYKNAECSIRVYKI